MFSPKNFVSHILSFYAELIIALKISGDVAWNKIQKILEKIDPEVDMAWFGSGTMTKVESAAGFTVMWKINKAIWLKNRWNEFRDKIEARMMKMIRLVKKKVKKSVKIDKRRSSCIYKIDDQIFEDKVVKEVVHSCCKNLIGHKKHIFENIQCFANEMEWINDRKLKIINSLMEYNSTDFDFLRMSGTLQLHNILFSIEHLICQTCSSEEIIKEKLLEKHKSLVEKLEIKNSYYKLYNPTSSEKEMNNILTPYAFPKEIVNLVFNYSGLSCFCLEDTDVIFKRVSSSNYSLRMPTKYN